MTYKHLPNDFHRRPVDPAWYRDLVDLFLSEQERRLNSLLILVCDDSGILLPTPIVIGGMVWDQSEEHRRRPFEVLGQVPGVASVIVATSPGTAHVTPEDRAWRATAEQVLGELGIELREFYAATEHSIEPVTVRAAA